MAEQPREQPDENVPPKIMAKYGRLSREKALAELDAAMKGNFSELNDFIHEVEEAESNREGRA